ncbi:tRNA (adenosine(37)-N6)-threonylcarbamoyltransferase complex ATPase subunit type 1 TsaE [Loktanella sp. DJP18]|uniref:tRNA (adenosine(37)-N6)-threonylcarbamoyltransferase complex ATPase subunit type 1 TsaE n=1 Tax=Loktanella sp. DJP18 TaxID=3409788 RepID=UPI003BB7C415
MSPSFLSLTLADADATARLAGLLAPRLTAGDTILLEGDIGAGKTTFARALIRARLRSPQEDVPSPTFTLVQTYVADDAEIWHCDLYRLTDPQEVLELGLDDAFAQAICLIEWPDRLGPDAPKGALLCHFSAFPDHHVLHLTGSAAWQDRLGDLHV